MSISENLQSKKESYSLNEQLFEDVTSLHNGYDAIKIGQIIKALYDGANPNATDQKESDRLSDMYEKYAGDMNPASWALGSPEVTAFSRFIAEFPIVTRNTNHLEKGSVLKALDVFLENGADVHQRGCLENGLRNPDVFSRMLAAKTFSPEKLDQTFFDIVVGDEANASNGYFNDQVNMGIKKSVSILEKFSPEMKDKVDGARTFRENTLRAIMADRLRKKTGGRP